MSQATAPFAEVVEAVERLTPDEQETLVTIVQRRLSAVRRSQIVADVQAAREELKAGACRPTTPDDLLREILS
ncbi:MAG: hypothetical protein L0211_18385 [Planctomycetaceae bacterium]|nr:hypothetical protein [Planctomycetaceae bacterium]